MPMLTTTLFTSSLSNLSRHLFVLAASIALTIGGVAARADEKSPDVKPAPANPAPAKDEPKAEPKVEPKTKDKADPKAPATKEPAKKEPEKKQPEKKEPPKPVAKAPLPPLKTLANAAWTKTAPDNAADLKAIQDRVQEITKRAIPWTVGLRVGGASGSGVIISKEGYVLTAGHVSAAPNQRIDIILHDGKVLRGKSLGRNTGID